LGIVQEAKLMEANNAYEHDVVRVNELVSHEELDEHQLDEFAHHVALDFFEWFTSKYFVDLELKGFRVPKADVGVTVRELLADTYVVH
jgi:hypothetical protein